MKSKNLIKNSITSSYHNIIALFMMTPKRSDNPKGISFGSMTPKVYSETSIFDGLVSKLVVITVS